MILTVTCNAAWDAAGIVPGLAVGHLHCIAPMVGQPGGKGINVARALHALGQPVLALGFAGGATGGRIHRGLKQEGVPCEFVGISQESRNCLAFLDPEGGTVTEMNEQGPVLASWEVVALAERLESRLGEASYVVFSGSLPGGMPASTYREWGELAHRHGVPFALDTKDEALAEGMRARPDLVKPNRQEAEALLGFPIVDDRSARRALSLLLAQARIAALTLGELGAWVGDGQVVLRVKGPQVTGGSPVGCGDAFLAGLIKAMLGGLSLQDAAGLAGACGAANASQLLPGCPSIDVERYLPEISVEQE